MKTAILHYSVPPVVGGVEAVIQAHTRLFLHAGYPVTLVAGAGEKDALPKETEFIQIPEMDSRNPSVTQASRILETGKLPDDFKAISESLESSLGDALQIMDHVIVHNIFSKHFNLPLTAALARLLDKGKIRHCIAWCHDFSWTSPHSRSNVHTGYPWDLLCTYREDVTYVTVSKHRQMELAGLFNCAPEKIHVIYDGVDPVELYGLSAEGVALVEHLDLYQADLILVMPVRITQAKNIEMAMQVVANLKVRGIQPKLVITGPPDPHDQGDMQYYQSLLDRRKQLGVEQEVCFVYGSGLQPQAGYTIGSSVVMELFRVSDALFMPSHREGFGMPILEAGMIGMPIFSTEIPAVQEIGGEEVTRFSPDDPSHKVAELILHWAQTNQIHGLRRRIRQKFIWKAIFQQDILPLLTGEEPA